MTKPPRLPPGGVWAIDVGNCALKALRCRVGDTPEHLVLDACEYIEYPKILTQPEAEPPKLVAEALDQLLSRNTLRRDRVAISVPGQSGLVRFIKVPPIEAKRIPDIIGFEARQCIPFDMTDVTWDYQVMGVGAIEMGFALGEEVGLFAMKRDQIRRILEPFQKVEIRVDLIQLTPIALFNYFVYDQLLEGEYDPNNPPRSLVLLSIGTDVTDFVVTNGYRMWQRSIPLGGKHFTNTLAKSLKLDLAEAEHLKRNFTTAEDPTGVFEAMRPVFGDLSTEIARSIACFTSFSKNAKVESILALGNAMKLPGLCRYLAWALGHEVMQVDEFRGLMGPEVDDPVFKDNAGSFALCYGLAVQGLKQARINTNLLHPSWEAGKPWKRWTRTMGRLMARR